MSLPQLKEVTANLTGGGKENETGTGKKPFSKPLYQKYTHAFINDPANAVTRPGPDGKPIKINVREAVVADVRKTVENAGYPQKSEIGVLENTEIATKNISGFVPDMIVGWLRENRKFIIPPFDGCSGAQLYVQPVKGKTRVVATRNMETGEPTGTSTITTTDHLVIRCKSAPPADCVTKVRKDVNGKVISQ